MTQQQRVQTRVRWRVDNPKPAVQPADGQELSKLRPYIEELLKEDHVKQWKRAQKQGKLDHNQ